MKSHYEQGKEYGYGLGYADGKEKAFTDIGEAAAYFGGPHARGCGCEPCTTIHVVLEVLLARVAEFIEEQGIDAAEVHGKNGRAFFISLVPREAVNATARELSPN